MSTELGALVRTLEDACRDGHAAFLGGRDVLLDLCRSDHLGRPRRPSNV